MKSCSSIYRHQGPVVILRTSQVICRERCNQQSPRRQRRNSAEDAFDFVAFSTTRPDFDRVVDTFSQDFSESTLKWYLYSIYTGDQAVVFTVSNNENFIKIKIKNGAEHLNFPPLV